MTWSTRSLDRAAAALLFVIGFATFLAYPIRVLNDSVYAVLLSETLVKRASFNVSHAFPDGFGENHSGSIWGLGHPYQLVPLPAGGYVYWYPPGASILSAPLVAGLSALDFTTLNGEGRFDPVRDEQVQGICGAFWAALFLAGSWLFCRLLLDRRWSLALAVLFTFGTSVASVNSRGLWAESVGTVVMLGALALMVRAERDGEPPPMALLATLLAWLFAIRPTYAFVIIPVTGYVLLRHRAGFPRYALAGGAWGALFFGWSLWLHGTLLPPYYTLGNRMEFANIPQGLVGALASPSRGLLVYSPFLLVILATAIAALVRGRSRPLLMIGAVVIALYMLVLGSWPNWWGGHSFGPRLSVGLIPWALAVAVVSMPVSPGRRRFVACALALLAIPSVFSHQRGMLSRAPYEWNWVPVYIDKDSTRLWDAEQPQFMAGIHRQWPLAKLPMLPVNGEVDFASKASQFVDEGWSAHEGKVRWTEGPRAVLSFRLAEGRRPTRLFLDVMPNVHSEKLPEVRFAVTLNGTRLTSTTLRERWSRAIEMDIPDGLLREENQLALETPDAASPRSMGEGTDPRALGVWVQAIRLTAPQ